jgi:hypothetical protein
MMLAVLLLPAGRLDAAPAPKVQKAMDQAVARIAEKLKRTRFPAEESRRSVENVAVLSIQGDNDGYMQSALKSVVANSRYKAFSRDQRELERIHQEIVENSTDKRGDIMDANSIQKFGHIQGVDAVLYGRVWRQDQDLQDNRGSVKLTVYLAHVETGELLWSSGPVQAQAYNDWTTMVERYWIYPAIAIGALIVLMVLGRAIKSATRPR